MWDGPWQCVVVMKRTVNTNGKGWFIGPWDSTIPVALGYADTGIDEPHAHDAMYEVYFIARGESSAVVAGHAVDLRDGDMLIVEPGESHTFVWSSDDYLHFVVQAPFVPGDKRRT